MENKESNCIFYIPDWSKTSVEEKRLDKFFRIETLRHEEEMRNEKIYYYVFNVIFILFYFWVVISLLTNK